MFKKTQNSNEVSFQNQNLNGKAEKPKKKIYKKWWFWLIIVVAIFGFGSMENGSNDVSNDTTSAYSNTEEISTTEDTPSDDNVESDIKEDTTIAENAVADTSSDTTNTNTSTSSYSAETIEYADAIAENGYSLSDAFYSFSTNVGLYDGGSEKWVTAVAYDVAIIRQLCQEAYAIDAPNDMKDINDKYLQAVWCFDEAMDKFVSGLDAGNSALIDEAGYLIEKGNGYINETTSMIEDYIK